MVAGHVANLRSVSEQGGTTLNERREEMKPLLFVAVLMLALSTSVFAGIDEPMVDNGSFDYSGAGWEYSESVIFGEYQGHDTTAYDPWPYPGASGYIRQIIDNSKSPYWNPALNHKIETLEFDLYTEGEGYVQIGFDWWDNYFGSQKPVGQAPMFEILPTQYQSKDHWSTISVTYDWLGKPGATWQPRWTSIEIYFFGCTNGNEAGVDSITVTSRCVPEPASLSVLLGGLVGLAGAWRRRK